MTRIEISTKATRKTSDAVVSKRLRSGLETRFPMKPARWSVKMFAIPRPERKRMHEPSIFEKTIEQAPDWCISRNRFWATPMPVWESSDGDRIVVSSIKEIEELSGQKVKIFTERILTR